MFYTKISKGKQGLLRVGKFEMGAHQINQRQLFRSISCLVCVYEHLQKVLVFCHTNQQKEFFFLISTTAEAKTKCKATQEQNEPDADFRWGNVNHFIISNVSHDILQRHGTSRRQTNIFIRSRSSHVGQFLFFGWIDFQIRWTSVFTDDHTGIHFFTRLHKKFTTIF
jgi:hypothetical protein